MTCDGSAYNKDILRNSPDYGKTVDLIEKIDYFNR